MSFSCKIKTSRSENSYDSKAQLERSAHEGEVTGEVQADANESNEENSISVSPDLVDEKIKSSLETL